MHKQPPRLSKEEIVVTAWVAIGLGSLVLLFVAQVYYGKQHRAGLPGGALLCVAASWIAILLAILIEKSGPATGWRRVVQKIDIPVILLLVGVLPFISMRVFPLSILQWLPTPLAIVITITPGILLTAVLSFRFVQSYLRHRRSGGA